MQFMVLMQKVGEQDGVQLNSYVLYLLTSLTEEFLLFVYYITACN